MEMAVRTPQEAVRWHNLQTLPDDRFFSIPANHWKDLSEIQVNIGIYTGQVSRFPSVRVRRMQEHKVDFWEKSNGRLEMGRIRKKKTDIAVSKTCMQLQRLRNARRILCGFQHLERLQDKPVVKRFILDAARATRLPDGTRK